VPRVKDLTCTCCNGLARGRQWWNQDTGHGLCVSCVEFATNGQTPEWVKDTYGEKGVNYAIPGEYQ